MANTEKIVVQVVVKGQKGLDKVGKSADKGTKSFGKMAAGIAAAAAAFATINRVVGSAIKSFRDFEFQMAKVKAVTGASEKDFKKLSNTAKELGRTTFFTAQQVAELQTNYGKLGFSTREILDAQEATLQLATATDVDLGRAAIVAGASIRGFGLDASEAGRVVDVMAKAFTSSALDIEKFQTSMTKVAPIAAAAGISLESTTAVMGTLTDAGIEASIAGTSLRNIFLKMQDSSSDLSKFLGYTVNSSDDLERALNDLNTAGLSNEEIMGLVDLRQVAAFNTMITGSKRIKELTNDLDNATGSAKRMADILADTLEGSFKRLTSATEGLAIELTEKLGGGLQGVVDKLAVFFNKLTDNSTAVAKVITGMITLVKWIGLYKVGVLAAQGATILWKNAVLLLNGSLKLTRAAIVKTGIGVFAIGLGELASRFLLVGEEAKEAARKMELFKTAKERIASEDEQLESLLSRQIGISEEQIDKNIVLIGLQIKGREMRKKIFQDEIREGMQDIGKKKEYEKEIIKINKELALLRKNEGLRMLAKRKLQDLSDEELLQQKSLITLEEEKMAVLLRMPETTEQEIANKHKLIDAQQLEIDKLKELGRATEEDLENKDNSLDKRKKAFEDEKNAINIESQELQNIFKQGLVEKEITQETFDQVTFDAEQQRLEDMKNLLIKYEEDTSDINGEILDNELQMIAAKDKADKDKAAKDKADKDKADKEELAQEKEAFREFQEVLSNKLQEELNANKQKLIDGEITQEEYDLRAFEAEQEHLENMKRLNNVYGEDVADINSQILDNELNRIKTIAQAELDAFKQQQNLKQQKIDLAVEAANAIMTVTTQNIDRQLSSETKLLEERKEAGVISQEEYEEGVEKVQRAAFEKKKKIALLEVIIDTAAAVMKIKAEAAVLLAGIFTAPMAAVALAQIPFVLASGAIQAGVIASQKFANGGLVHGKSHAQGGERFAVGGRVVELEGGEAVINKRSTAMFSKQLSAMNSAGGGVKFADGGLLNMPSFSQQQFNAIGQNQMMGAMGSSSKVVVVEADITDSQNSVSVIQSEATI
jgi:TP901 family phage tail tape measure protein